MRTNMYEPSLYSCHIVQRYYQQYPHNHQTSLYWNESFKDARTHAGRPGDRRRPCESLSLEQQTGGRGPAMLPERPSRGTIARRQR